MHYLGGKWFSSWLDQDISVFLFASFCPKDLHSRYTPVIVCPFGRYVLFQNGTIIIPADGTAIHWCRRITVSPLLRGVLVDISVVMNRWIKFISSSTHQKVASLLICNPPSGQLLHAQFFIQNVCCTFFGDVYFIWYGRCLQPGVV